MGNTQQRMASAHDFPVDGKEIFIGFVASPTHPFHLADPNGVFCSDRAEICPGQQREALEAAHSPLAASCWARGRAGYITGI